MNDGRSAWVYSRHQACTCGYGWYGRDDESCRWCIARTTMHSELPRPIDFGVDARSPGSNIHQEMTTP